MLLTARLMVWLEAKVLPLATATVMVELMVSPSSISAGCADTVHVASSLSEMVTVAEPMDCPPWTAVTITVSSPSTMASSVAVTVAVAELAPALRVSSVAERL